MNMVTSKKSDLIKFKKLFLARSKIQDLTKSKKLDLLNNFTKALIITDFFTLRAIKDLIHLYKTFIKALILWHFNSKYYI